MYDWANSAFATTMMAAVLPIFYYEVAAQGIDGTLATAYWGYSQSLAMFIVAVLAPVLGAVSDYAASKKKFLAFFAYMGMIASVLFAFVGAGDYVLASLLLVIGTVGFSAANVFYDAFLPEISTPEEIDRISARGYAMGYLGGGLLLLVNLIMIQFPQLFHLTSLSATRLAFITVGLWWFFFSLPLFRRVHENRSGREGPKFVQKVVYIGATRVINTVKTIRRYPELLKFLLAFWLYSDGISTIIKMATIYGKDLGIGTPHLIAALLITQFVGIPFAFLFGRLAKKISAKRALALALFVYVIIVLLGYFMSSALHFYVLACMVGFVQGGAQALSRSLYAGLIPYDRRAEFFGFYGISSKFAAIFGPFLFAVTSQLSGNSRAGILSVAFFFLAGLLLLKTVRVEKGKEEARSAPSSQQGIGV